MDFIEALDAYEVRRFLGVDRLRAELVVLVSGLEHIKASQYRLETEVDTARDQLDNLSAKVDDLLSDVRAARAALEQDRGNLAPDAQEALDQLSAKIEAFDAEVGDADGSDAPAPPAETGDEAGDEAGEPTA